MIIGRMQVILTNQIQAVNATSTEMLLSPSCCASCYSQRHDYWSKRFMQVILTNQIQAVNATSTWGQAGTRLVPSNQFLGYKCTEASYSGNQIHEQCWNTLDDFCSNRQHALWMQFLLQSFHSQGLNKCACIITHESNFKQTAGLMDASFVAKHSQPRIE